MKFILATTNKNKLSEINDIAKEYGIEFELPQTPIEVDEDGETLYENALKKAEFYPNPLKSSTSFQMEEKKLLPKQQENFYVLSDDTGLFVEALGGAPGIHSARYDTTSEKRIEKLLNALKDKTNRNAKFLCTMVLLSSNGEILITNTGEIKGSITNTLKGVNGFGYDPIFFIDHLNKTMAQLTKEEKNTVSHRAKALIPILEFIKTSIL